MEPLRQSLVRQLYRNRKANYRSLTRFTNCRTIQARLDAIKTLVRETPLHKRTPKDATFKKLGLERRLLGWKHQIYLAERSSLPLEVSLIRHSLELTDGETGESAKEEQAVNLLYISLYTTSVEDLRRLLLTTV